MDLRAMLSEEELDLLPETTADSLRDLLASGTTAVPGQVESERGFTAHLPGDPADHPEWSFNPYIFVPASELAYLSRMPGLSREAFRRIAEALDLQGVTAAGVNAGRP